jgi:hypothetical protein
MMITLLLLLLELLLVLLGLMHGHLGLHSSSSLLLSSGCMLRRLSV